MRRPTVFTVGLLAVGLTLTACAAAEPEPLETETPAIEIERNYDLENPCALLTGDELVAAMGVAEAGLPLDSVVGRSQSARPTCGWELSEDTRNALGVVDDRAVNNQTLRLTFETFDAPPSCFGAPCSTPEEYIDAWSAEWLGWYTEREQFPGQFVLVESPDLLLGAAAVGVRGIIFLDPQTIAHAEFFRCESEGCAAAVIGIQQAIADKLG